MSDSSKRIEQLIAKAADAEDSGDAMRFSQAAANAANALCAVKTANKRI